MTEKTLYEPEAAQRNSWLKSYYFARAAFSIVWVAAALTLGENMFPIAAALLLIYPTWDAVANLVDAQRNGGLKRNPTQALNAAASVAVTVAVAIALAMSMNAVLGVFGVWATLSGLLQLATGVRRRKTAGAQWPMILSGAQSAVVGFTFLKLAVGSQVPSVADVAPYAAFGAFYFLLSAVWLTVSEARNRRTGLNTAA